jgi:hypothetical protein
MHRCARTVQAALWAIAVLWVLCVSGLTVCAVRKAGVLSWPQYVVMSGCNKFAKTVCHA